MSRWLKANYKREADVTTDLKRAVKWLKDKVSDLPGDFRQKFITDPWNAAKEFLLGTDSRDYNPMEIRKLRELKHVFEGSFEDDLNNKPGIMFEDENEYYEKLFPKVVIPVGSNQEFVKGNVYMKNRDENTVSKKSKKYDEGENYLDRYDELGDKEFNNQAVCYYNAVTENFYGDTTNAPTGAIFADEPEYFYWGNSSSNPDGFREKSKYKVIEY